MILLSILCGCLAVAVVVLAVKLRAASLEADRWKRRHNERDADYNKLARTYDLVDKMHNKQVEENVELVKQMQDLEEQLTILKSDDPDGIIAERLEKIRKMQEETEMNAKFTSFMAQMLNMMNTNAAMQSMNRRRF